MSDLLVGAVLSLSDVLGYQNIAEAKKEFLSAMRQSLTALEKNMPREEAIKLVTTLFMSGRDIGWAEGMHAALTQGA